MKVMLSWSIFMCCLWGMANAQAPSLEQKAQDILRDLKQMDEGGYAPVPSDTRLVAIKARDGKVSLRFDFSPAFLAHEFDDMTHELMVESFSGGLSAFQLSEVQLKAKSVDGQYVALSSFLKTYEAPVPLAHNNADPLPSTKGVVRRSGVKLKNPAQPDGQLRGKTVWLSAGHGWHARRGGIATQRSCTHGLVEDFTTAEFVNYHLLKYLYQAGANVWTVRERDMNPNEVIVACRDRKPSYTEKGAWANSRSRGYKGASYRYAISGKKETATATFKPYIPESGLYWVSVHYTSGLNRSVDTRYKITHAGGVSEVSINQEVHGNTWVYLGQFYFEKGRQGYVQLSNLSTEKGQAVIADAVRFGGGKGSEKDCYGGKSSQAPRFEESARYYAHYQGYPKCVNDVVIRPLYAEWELAKGHPKEQNNAIYLSLHTNANGPGGTESYVHAYRHTADARRLQAAVHDQLISDLRQGWRKNWKDRGRKRADFGELRSLKKMPGVLLELAFHDHASDAKDLTEPQFRQLAARGIYKGIVRYFAQKNNEYPVYLPETPTHIYAQSQGPKRIKVSWKAPLFGGELGSKAASYKIYISQHGKAFADYAETSKTEWTFDGLAPSTTYYFRVAAVNKGGESFPSSVLAVRTPAAKSQGEKLLIVDGYDRLNRGLSFQARHRLSSYSRPVKVHRLFLDRMNNFDYMAEHAEAAERCDIPFDGASNEAIVDGITTLSNYAYVNWFVGRESTADQTLSLREQARLSRYLDQGGNLIISGSELGYDLDRKGNGRDFYRDYLKAEFQADDAKHLSFQSPKGKSQTFLKGHLKNNRYGMYPLKSPDVIKPIDGSRVLLKYPSGQPAALSYNGSYGLVYFAFPLETVQGKALRGSLLKHALASMTTSSEKPLLARLPAKIRNQLDIRMSTIPEGRAVFRIYDGDGRAIKEHHWKHHAQKKETILTHDIPPNRYAYELVVLGQRQRGMIEVE
ncbi:MAG: N-acetylmuramoyl-L-alanine amidase [Bacteroidota bacterium]